jgi:DMSO/TMAO reductase YedYZ molybdopterin-dependent catalytic subunit
MPGEVAGHAAVPLILKHHCVEGWSAIAGWHGVPVSAIVERCRPLEAARYITFTSFDSGYSAGCGSGECHDTRRRFVPAG